MSKPKTISLAGLVTVFGVSSMSIFLWRKGTPTKEPLAEPYTPAALRRWAKANGRPIVKDPDVVLQKEVAASEKTQRKEAVRSTGKAIDAARKSRAVPARKLAKKKATSTRKAPTLLRSGSGKLTSVRTRPALAAAPAA